MTDRLGRLEPSRPRPGLRLWLRPEVASAWAEGVPEEGERLGSSGRGDLLRVASPLGPALVRTYRRGGLLRHLLPDRFVSAERALREVLAAERLEPRGLAPAVLALEVEGVLGLRLRLAVAEVAGARDLLRLAEEEPARLSEPVLGRAVGRAVAGVHEAGVSHADLNAANVLVAPSGDVLLIDFDGAAVLDGPLPDERRLSEALRLCRSVDKWAATARASAAARGGFLRAALPAHLWREALRLGRLQHARRVRLGRTGRAAPG